MIGKDEDGVLDKRIGSDNGVPMEATKANEHNSDGDENLEEYEEELDPAGIKNTGINIDSANSKEDHEKDEGGLETKVQEELEQDHRQEEFVAEKTTYGEEQEEEEFEKEGEEEINGNKQGGGKQPKQRVEQKEDKEEKMQQEQNYEANVMDVQDEKYKKGNAETNEENDYFPQHKYKEDEAEDPDKGIGEREEQEEQVPSTTQEERNQNDEQDKQHGQDESEGLEEQDDYEEENYRKLVNQSEGLKNEQRPDKQKEEIVVTQKYKESMKHDDNKEASISKTQSFKMADEGVLSNKTKRNEDLTEEDEDEETKGKSSNEHDDVTLQDEGEENKSKSSHEQTERFGASLETVIKPASVINESKANDKSSVAQDVKDSVYLPPLKKVEERVELQTDRTEGDVKLKANGYSTKVSEMVEDKTTMNREEGQENNATKSTELVKQGPGETEKVSEGEEVGYQTTTVTFSSKSK